MLRFSKPIAAAKPDQITSQIIAARQRNESAGESAQSVIRELLEASDGAKRGRAR